MTRESKIEKQICDYAVEHGWIVRKIKWIGRRGAPDRMFIRRGEVKFVEFKAPDGRPTVQQMREMKRLSDAGAKVYVMDKFFDDAEVVFR